MGRWRKNTASQMVTKLDGGKNTLRYSLDLINLYSRGPGGI